MSEQVKDPLDPKIDECWDKIKKATTLNIPLEGDVAARDVFKNSIFECIAEIARLVKENNEWWNIGIPENYKKGA